MKVDIIAMRYFMSKISLLILALILMPVFSFGKTFTLKWVSSPNVEHYEVEFASTEAFHKPLVKTTTTNQIEFNIEEILSQLNLPNTASFYVRCKAVFKTGMLSEYTKIRKISLKKHRYGIYTTMKGERFVPGSFKLEFIFDKYDDKYFKNKILFFRLGGRKSKIYRYKKGQYVSFSSPSGKNEIQFYFANPNNFRPSKWFREYVIVDVDPPVLSLKVLGGIPQSDGSYKVRPTDIIEITANDHHSGLPEHSILYSLEQDKPVDKKGYLIFSEPLVVSDILKKLSVANQKPGSFTLFYKAYDNVGNESDVKEMIFKVVEE